MPPDTEVNRDRWGRPLIVPPDGGKAVAYTRMSTLAKVLDDPYSIMAWKQRMTAVGLLKRPALMTRVSGLVASGDLDDYKTKRALNKVCDEALEASGASDKASRGTGLHALTEALDAGLPVEHVADEDRARLDQYQEATAHLEPLRAEGFVVCDEIQAAGSYDRLWMCPDGRARLGDLKTGSWDAKFPMGVTAQLAGYANGMHYDVEGGERETIHPDLDTSTGLLIHMPPSGGCEVIPLDLTVGWRVLKAAIETRALRKYTSDMFVSDVSF